MTNLEKYQHTVSVLAEAYLNDTLEKGNCAACAVGNLVSEALGFSYVKPTVRKYKMYNEIENPAGEWTGEWADVFMTSEEGQQVREDRYKGVSKQQIDATGYTWQELARIEYAFETAMPGKSPESEYAGLMAVVEVLAEIHNISKKEMEQDKLLFVR